MSFHMLRHLALAALSFAVVAIGVFPYWVAVERLENQRIREAAIHASSAPLRISMQCPATGIHASTGFQASR